MTFNIHVSNFTDTYEVLFDDGYIKVLKFHKLSRYNEDTVPDYKKLPLPHAAPLFDPVVGSKQERRDRKRKINVAELFHRKRHRYDEPSTKMEHNQEEEKTPVEEYVPSSTPGMGFFINLFLLFSVILSIKCILSFLLYIFVVIQNFNSCTHSRCFKSRT